MERGNLKADAKGEIQIAETMRIRVPRQLPGTDQPVVVKKLL
jgi:hypothetical protein